VTKEQLKLRVAEQGSHFFEPATMRFFDSRLCTVAGTARNVDGEDHVYFVTSDKGPNGFRAYTIRRFHWTGAHNPSCVETGGLFQAYRDRRNAVATARAIVAAGVKR
jgi:hypothetical protein